jgi:hypothetical protein
MSRATCTTRRSARRQTVRATWSAADFGVPPGRMNAFSGSSSLSPSSSGRALTRGVRAARHHDGAITR